MDAWNEVEIFLRVYGRLPEGKDNLKKEDYKKYCDIVMEGKKCPRGRVYCMDGLWNYSWERYKLKPNP